MDKNIKKNDMHVFKADLHIHTPASKCYKGPKEDEEYIRIIKKAEEKGLKIIAITDHNSIEGYEKLIDQQERIKAEVDGLKKLSDSKEAKRIIKEDEKLLNLFNSMLILPGIEFEVNNGVHMLVIFNPETDITTIKDFLKNGGFDSDSFGKEDDVFSNWSLFDFYNESRKYDCLIFDAHTDSNKGIFNTIQEGTTRIHAFTDNALVGICYKNERQKNNIRKLFLQPTYRRTNPVAFLKSSDAHKTDDIGNEKTFFRIKNLNWYDFKDSFNNPDECIFTSNPNTKKIINNISNTGRCIFISELNERHVDVFAESLCGLNNAGGGYVVIGADSKDVVNGIEIRNKDKFKELKDLIDKISLRTKLNLFSVNFHLLKDGFYIIVVKIDSNDELVDVDNDGVIYCCKKGENVKLNASQIQQVLTRKIEAKYQHHLSKELAIISKSISAVDTYLKSQPILNSYGKISTTIYNYVSFLDVQQPTRMTIEQKQTLSKQYEKHENGCYKGNIIFIDSVLKPRLKDAYLRITPPKFNLKGLKKLSDKKFLYVAPGGAVFYSESELNYHNNKNIPVLKIEVTDNYPIKFLGAFLKSSFFLWYVKNKFGDFDFYKSDVFNYIAVPLIHLSNPIERELITKIEDDFDRIIELEKNFLRTDLKTIKDFGDYVFHHNEKTKSYFKSIDESIFNLLKLKDEEVLIIKENLRANYIYIPE